MTLIFASSSNVHSLYQQMREQRRSLDSLWEIVSAEHAILVTLMPLVGGAAVEGYLLRIQIWLREHMGMDFDEAHITSHRALLDDGDAALTLQRLIAVSRGGVGGALA